jgi:alcohol dehydrogenase class IV
VAQILGHAFQCSAAQSPLALAEWAKTAGLPGLAAQGLAEDQFPSVAEAALLSSSMKANPVVPTAHELVLALMAAK